MDGFLRITAGTLITVVLYIAVAKQAKDVAVVIGAVSCVLIAAVAFDYLQPVISFFSRLRTIGKLDPECVTVLLRCVGIGMLSELVSLICIDSGNAALGKTLQFASAIIILWISLPLFTKLIALVEDILLLV